MTVDAESPQPVRLHARGGQPSSIFHHWTLQLTCTRTELLRAVGVAHKSREHLSVAHFVAGPRSVTF